MNIIEAIHSEKIFKPLFKDLETWRSWMTFLKALFALPIQDDERQLLKLCTGLDEVPSPSREAYVIAGRRSGKSTVTALIAIYLALFKDWTKYFAPGERPFIFIIGVNKAQCRIVKSYCEAILSLKTFKPMVKKVLAESIELQNGITIEIRPCSFRSLRGYTVLCAILEELAFWRFELESANPDKEILTALKPALATIPESLLIGISTPYSKAGVLWQKFEQSFGNPEAPLIWKAETRLMNPTIPIGEIERAFKDDPESALSEWQGEFRTDISSFCNAEVIETAVIPRRYQLPWSAEQKYFGFIDSSGGRSDSFTLALSYQSKTGKAVLAVAEEAIPPFKPSAIVERFSEVLKEYKVFKVESDCYAGEWVSSAFKEFGIDVIPSRKSKSEIYAELLPLLNNGSLELLDNKRLLNQLRSLERRTRSQGRELIDCFYPGSHDDLINSAAGSLTLAARQKEERKGKVYHGGLSISSQEKNEKPQVGRKGKVYIQESPPARDLSLEEKIREALHRWRNPPDKD